MTVITSVEMWCMLLWWLSHNVNGLDLRGKIREGLPTHIPYSELKPADTDWYPANKF